MSWLVRLYPAAWRAYADELAALLGPRRPAPTRGLVWFAFLVPATGAVVSLVGLAGMALRPDEELVAGLSGWAIWSLGMMATIVGAGLFGAVTYLTAALSRTGALVLTGGATLGIVSIAFGVFGGPDQAMGPLLLVLGSVVLGAGWIMLGLDAVRRDVPRKVELPAEGPVTIAR